MTASHETLLMLERCYRHQHPEEFGRVAIDPESPRETTGCGYETTPTGANQEGYLPEERPCESGP